MSKLTLQDAVGDLYRRACVDKATTSTARLSVLANLCVQELRERGLADAEIDPEIPGFARAKDWDVAWSHNGKARLAISLKSLLKNLAGTVPNRIDDLIGEAANLQMHSPETAVGYVMLFRATARPRTGAGWVASGETVTQAHSWPSAGSYQVKAQAKDNTGSTSSWSTPLTVTITSNQPPGTPAIPTGPSTVRKDSGCFYTSIATDPDGDGVSYRFAWGNDDTSVWSGWTQSGSPGGMGYAYPRAGSFQVRAQARDANEALSVWSNPFSVIITNPYPPDAPPTPVGPSGGESGEPLSFSATASDLGGDSVSIRFSWDAGDTSTWSSLVPSHDTVTATHVWSHAGNYQVKAQAKDEDGLASGWSQATTVEITQRKWRYQTGGFVMSSPAAAADGTVYVGSSDDYLYAINLDGTLKWRYETDSSITSSPAVAADGTIYVGSDDNYLYAINPTGTLKWRYQTGGDVYSSPAVAADGTIYVGSYDYYLYAINPTGTLKWRYQTYTFSSSPAVAADGTVYVGSGGDFHLYAIDPTGTLKWRYATGERVSSPVVATDGTVYVGSSDDYLYAINPGGTLRWRCQTGGGVASPAVATDGTVYVGSGDGYLYAFQGDSPLADSPWPKFHHDNKYTGRVGGGR